VLWLDATDPWIRWDWLGHHTDVIWQAVLQHIQLTGIAVVGGLVIATPVGLLVWRWRALRNPVLSVAGILYTIPSLALFALLVPFTGLTVVTAEIGLVSYTILILVRNIVVGLDGVPVEIREAATGMGYRPAKRLLTIDIPLALPVIVAGVRLATVTTIGLVTVTALLGEGGLGQLILAGLIQDFKTPLVVGLAGSVVLAVAADLLLAGAQRLATPWRSSR
jgi:osmoprotectant transport system permease protein